MSKFFFFTACITISGPKTYKPCVFPFEYKEDIYHGCTWERSALTAKRPWCSTKVDKDGKHLNGIGEWGYCDLKCTGMYCIHYYCSKLLLHIYMQQIFT